MRRKTRPEPAILVTTAAGSAGRDVEGDAVVTAVGTHVDEPQQSSPERLMLDDVGLDLRQLRPGGLQHTGARTRVGGGEEIADLGEREAQRLRPAYELK